MCVCVCVCVCASQDWEENNPSELAGVLAMYSELQVAFNGKGGNQVSMADLIVLGGCAAVEEAAKAAGEKTAAATKALVKRLSAHMKRYARMERRLAGLGVGS